MYQSHICTPFLRYFLQTYYHNNVYHDLIKYEYISINQCNVLEFYNSLLRVWRSFDKQFIGKIEPFKFNWCIYPLKCYIVGSNLTYE